MNMADAARKFLAQIDQMEPRSSGGHRKAPAHVRQLQRGDRQCAAALIEAQKTIDVQAGASPAGAGAGQAPGREGELGEVGSIRPAQNRSPANSFSDRSEIFGRRESLIDQTKNR
jgi:hypothetical protein